VNASIASDALDAKLSLEAFVFSTLDGLKKAFFEHEGVSAVILLIADPRVTVATVDVQVDSVSKQFSKDFERLCSTNWKKVILMADSVTLMT